MRLPALPGLALLLVVTIPATSRAQLVNPGRPPCPSAIPDGSRVRADRPDTRDRVTGRALGWGTTTPRIITRGNDTIVIDATRRRDASAGRVARSRKRGAIAGLLAGALVISIDCIGESSSCGEQNPIPLLGALIGTGIGHFVKHEQWVRLPDDAACAPATR